jgi:hypothetical protein
MVVAGAGKARARLAANTGRESSTLLGQLPYVSDTTPFRVVPGYASRPELTFRATAPPVAAVMSPACAAALQMDESLV